MTSEQEQRQAVVAEARSWLGTPWAHACDIKGAGVDCGMLLVRCLVDTGVLPPFDPRPYRRHWYLHKDDDRYLALLRDHCHEIAGPPEGPPPRPGDVVAFVTGRTHGHAAIVTDWPMAIHAYWGERRVVQSDLSQAGPLTVTDRRYFTPWRRD